MVTGLKNMMQSLFKRYIIIFISFLNFNSLYTQKDSAESPSFEVNVNKSLMGTEIVAQAICKNANKGKEALYFAFKEIERIDSLYSMYGYSSIIRQINMNSGIRSTKVTWETFSIIKRAINYSKKYDGLFDITIGSLTDLWGFSSDREVIVPAQSKIKSLLPLVSYKNIILKDKDTTVFLQKKGMMLDLGGIAKGYAVDRACEILRKNGINDFMLDAGGDLCVSGKNSKGEDWVIGIEHPRKKGEVIASFKCTNTCVATSGDYERFIIVKGVRYHHILLPSTGIPGRLSRSVTVIFNNTEEGTVLDKYIFLTGIKKFGKTKLAKSLKYFVVAQDGKITYSPQLKKENGLIITK